jgi:hypothetical protein
MRYLQVKHGYMSRIRFFTLSLFFITLGFKAQSPGYMGRKCALGYGFYINPAITAAIADYGTSVVNTKHEFFFEGAVKTRLSMGVSFQAYRTSYNNTSKISMESMYKYNMSETYSGDLSPEGAIKISAFNYALYFKFYKSGYVAPWGKYRLLGITYNTRTCTYNPDEMKIVYVERGYDNMTSTYTVTPHVFNNFGSTQQNYSYPDILFGAGNSRILWRQLVVDYGYNIHLIALTATVLDAFDVYRPDVEKYVQINSAMRVRGINRFNFFFKLGYLF